MTEHNFIFLIYLESEMTDLQNCVLKITENYDLKSQKKKKQLRSLTKDFH